MIIYLSLKQLILNQIAVLLRKKSDKSNDDPERLEKRLKYLQRALEQMKSYDHNKNYQLVTRHFHQGLTAQQQEDITRIAQSYDDFDPHSRQVSKSGFTTTRSETLFTGAAEDVYGLGHDGDDEKHSRHDHHRRGPLWIHYQGFANWLKGQSFIKFKKRKDEEKYKQIWEHMLGIKLIRKWTKQQITLRNLIGPFPSSTPYIDIQKAGSREIVKASLLRQSIVQNRIFKFEVDLDETTKHSRSRRSVDMDNEEDPSSAIDAISANELITEKNLFNRVQNKDVLRIVATILFDKTLAGNVLEELIQNPRFSMCGTSGKLLAKALEKEFQMEAMDAMNHRTSPSPQHVVQREEAAAAVTPLSQFQIPSPSAGSPQSRLKGSSKSPAGGVYSPQHGDTSEFSNSFQYKSNSASSGTTMSPSPHQQGYTQGHDSRYGTSSHSSHAQYHQNINHHDHLQHDVSSPSLSPNAVIPKHKGHSDSVVYHQGDLQHHKNFSEIGYGDEEEEEYGDDMQYNH